MWSRAATIFLALTLLSSLAGGQDHTNHRRGLEAPTAYLADNIDSVNLFNGNLTLRIPIGGTYPAGGGLSYSMTLHYNSHVWEFDEGDPEGQPPLPTIYAYTTLHSNAGVGWLLSLGRLWRPQLPPLPQNPGNSWLLVEPDGTRRVFWSTLHEPVCPPEPEGGKGVETFCEEASENFFYTRDGSYLRLRTFAASHEEVESPDGIVRVFDYDGILQSVRDRFGNRLDITYEPTRWLLRDTAGGLTRTHEVEFHSGPGPLTGQVASVRLAAFGGTTAVYSFAYSQVFGGVRHPNHSAVRYRGLPVPPLDIALLTSVTLPSGESWTMEYFDGVGAPPPGLTNPAQTLKSLGLPTLGTFRWDYGTYAFPSQNPPPRWFLSSDGVRYKRLIPVGGTYETADKWEYRQDVRPGWMGGAPGETERRTWVIDPLANTTVHFFTNDNGYWSHGLPFSPAADVKDGDLFLSRQTYRGAPLLGNLLRKEYVRFTSDWGGLEVSNQRMEAQKTVFVDDGNRFASIAHSEFDGLGHFRRSETSGNFDSGNLRRSTTRFNASSGIYDFDANTFQWRVPPEDPTFFVMWEEASPWILNTFEFQEQQEGTLGVNREEFVFESASGRLACRRALKNGAVRGAQDLLVVFDHQDGNLSDEKFYGAESPGQALSTAPGCAAFGGSLPDYWIHHEYQYGARKSGRYRQSDGTPLPYFSARADIDLSTGLASKTYDTADLETTLRYDAMGRPVEEWPQHGPRKIFGYRAAHPQLGAGQGVSLALCPPGASCPYAVVSSIDFDWFGRAIREEVPIPDRGFSSRTWTYNAMGWVTEVSEVGSPNSKTLFLAFDPFGRPGTIRPPEGSAHDLSFLYRGVREIERTALIGETWTGSAVSESPATTTERYDRQGRLYQVIEPSDSQPAGPSPGGGGNNNSPAVDAATTYSYDSGSRLVQVVQQTLAAAQQRSWQYDGRGFLSEESHPELPDVKIKYPSYDTLGHAIQRVVERQSPPPAGEVTALTLFFGFDWAGNLTLVEQNNPTGSPPRRDLKRFLYAETNGGNDFRAGKLVQATRVNHFDSLGVKATVDEFFTYGGQQGRLSQKRTQHVVAPAGSRPTNNEEIVQNLEYWGYGHLSSETYPQFIGSHPCSGHPARTVSYVRAPQSGRLTSVDPWLPTISYHLNGTVDQVHHSNGVVDTYGADPFGRARPASVTAQHTPSSSTRWASGGYLYDGAGNVTRIGGAYFLYDGVSRLKEARLDLNPLPGAPIYTTQTYTFDGYGNLTAIGGAGGRNLPTSATSNRLTSGTYDLLGNLVSWNLQQSVFDSLNLQAEHCTSWQSGSCVGERWLNIYTASDERLYAYRTSDGLGRWTLRDLGDRVLRQFSLTGAGCTLDKEYLYRDGQLAAELVEGRHFSLDHLGSPRLVTNASGAQVAWHTYYPFGEEATTPTQNTERLKFTAHERDLFNPTSPADDLDYLHARFLSPLTGRFLTFDPIADLDQLQRAPQSWNRYTYAAANPLKFVDPTGLYIVGSQRVSDFVQEALDEAGVQAQVKLERVEIRHSFLGFEWTTTETRLSSGDVDLSKSDNPTARLIGSAIATDERIEIAITNRDLSDFGGAYTDPTFRDKIKIAINPTQVESMVVPGALKSGPLAGTRVGLGFSTATAMVHELGHAFGYYAGAEPRFWGNTNYWALKYENLHRQLLARPPLVPLVREEH